MSASLWSIWAEATMLVCFGLAWPVATLRLLCGAATGGSGGRGLGFTALILLGYIAGGASKLLSGATPLPPVFWLYLLNACSVSAHLTVQWMIAARGRERGPHGPGNRRERDRRSAPAADAQATPIS
ncbi:MAG: hypothetical protein ABJA81_12435 [Nocardioidaceae bacterium]